MQKGEVYRVKYNMWGTNKCVRTWTVEVNSLGEGPFGPTLHGIVLQSENDYVSGQKIQLRLDYVTDINPTKRPAPEFQEGDVYVNTRGITFLYQNGRWYTDTQMDNDAVAAKVAEGSYRKADW